MRGHGMRISGRPARGSFRDYVIEIHQQTVRLWGSKEANPGCECRSIDGSCGEEANCLQQRSRRPPKQAGRVPLSPRVSPLGLEGCCEEVALNVSHLSRLRWFHVLCSQGSLWAPLFSLSSLSTGGALCCGSCAWQAVQMPKPPLEAACFCVVRVLLCFCR
jgi:hypothetical protein